MPARRHIVFLAGMFPATQRAFIIENSIGVIQNAADAYQKNVIAGLGQLEDVNAVVVNLPFISAWPSSFKNAWFPAVADRECGVPIEGRGFANASLVRYFARLISAFFGLQSGSAARADTILVYSAHVPFMIAAVLAGRVFGRRQLAIIVLDLPEFMGAMGLAQKLFGGINQTLFYRLIRIFDKVVVLTAAMIPRLGIEPANAAVVEGIVTAGDRNAAHADASDGKSFLYTGTLALRYGIKELVDGFRMIDCADAALWVCGAGEGADYVVAAAAADPRIRFFGQVDRSKALELQAQASFLVNPRGGDDEFVQYSFPSKVMEYLASGRPTIMYDLPGIPDDYDGHYLPIGAVGAAGIDDARRARGYGMRRRNLCPLEQGPARTGETHH
jgi:glycosyltransferase involved in cell wall biosynthesis